MKCWWPVIVLCSFLSALHSLRVSSSPQVTSLASGRTLTLLTQVVWARKALQDPVWRSHCLTVPSAELLRSSPWTAASVRLRTVSVWPLRVCSARALCRSQTMMVWSREPELRRPLLSSWREVTAPACPLRTALHLAVSTTPIPGCQMLTTFLVVPLARQPPGSQASDSTLPATTALIICWGSPESRSQTRIVPSSLPLASRRVVIVPARERMESRCPLRDLSVSLVSRSHNRIILSSEPLAAVPSSSTVTHVTRPMCPCRVIRWGGKLEPELRQ
mmetsp:Transcript_25762/g.72097  ORF Transcript_25762/g.72097 Transcript_25762/m.72097 type:complete len:275 (-) Transcript_25762:2647-3471(-)